MTAEIENSNTTENVLESGTAPVASKMTESPEAKILKQMEFYFSDANLPQDDFLIKEVAKDTDGFVPLEVFLRFRRIKDLTSDLAVIAKALEKSEFLSLSEDKQKVKRSIPLPAHIDDTDRTIYAKGFRLYPEPSIEELSQFFSKFGKVDAVRLRRYVAPKKFKGSVFVTFSTAEEAQHFLQQQKDLSYGDHHLELHSRAEYDASEYAKGSVPTEHVQWSNIFDRRKVAEESGADKKESENKAFTPFSAAHLVKFSKNGQMTYQDIRANVNKIKPVARVVVPGRDLDYGMIAFKDAVAEEFLASNAETKIGELTLTCSKPSDEEVETFNKMEAGRVSRDKLKKTSTTPGRAGKNAVKLQPGCTVKFILKEDSKTPEERRALQAQFEKYGQIALLELRRYHKCGLINFTKTFNRALFMRKIAETPITDAQQRPVECQVPSDEEEKDLFARSRAMHEAQELEKQITKEDLKFPARYDPSLKSSGRGGNANKAPINTKRKADEAAPEEPEQKKVAESKEE